MAKSKPAPKQVMFRKDDVSSAVQQAVGRIEIHLSQRNFAAAIEVVRELESVTNLKGDAHESGIRKLNYEAKLNLPVSMIGLSVRTANALEEANVTKVRALVFMRPDDLELIPNFGPKSLLECLYWLEKLGVVAKHFPPLTDDQYAEVDRQWQD